MNIGEWECGDLEMGEFGDQRWGNVEIRDGRMWRLEMGECGDQRWGMWRLEMGEYEYW